ncbi:hypothetical protein TSAR_001559 [Trichomalopsis sarcophagae]|uniref:Uncharacterized protein n=1 Tax=Trichomalopsis sarcophagae TaxID=543379 RepID=A0A232F2E1_9HYME|nr:hypothetical protein TSAR_001559 [Trichomalopsis sarcophagae]
MHIYLCSEFWKNSYFLFSQLFFVWSFLNF